MKSMGARIPELLSEYAVTGAAIGVVDSGEVVWSAGYGLADVDSDTLVTDTTVFQAASISKSVTTWGVMRLSEEGLLDLDTPVEQYLTRWQLPPSDFGTSGVTARRLLSHTAGLSVHGYPGFPADVALPSVEQSLSGNFGGFGAVELIAEPGLAYQYSGGGYTVLQLLVEEITGEPFASYMQREVLDRLGMMSSAFTWTEQLHGNTASAYDGSGAPVPNYLFVEQAAAGLYTTAPDLARWLAAAMDSPADETSGRGVISPKSLDAMYTPVLGTYGLGHFVTGFPESGPRIEHSGANQGWRSYFVSLPEQGKGLVLLTNSDNADPPGSVTSFRSDVVCIWAASANTDAFPECPRR